MNGTLQLLGSRAAAGDSGARTQHQQAPREPHQHPAGQPPAQDYDTFDDDIPF